MSLLVRNYVLLETGKFRICTQTC